MLIFSFPSFVKFTQNGRKPAQDVPLSLKTELQFYRDIGQLQTMAYKAHGLLDGAERIYRNKHAAADTGTQQPCDLSLVFWLLRQLQKILTERDANACSFT